MVDNLYPDQPTMPKEQIRELFFEVQQGMAEHVTPSLTPIYFPSSSDPDFMENGTGAFVDVKGTKLLVSNWHVVKNRGVHYSFFGFNEFVRAGPQRYGWDYPIDIGALKVPAGLWDQYASNASPIPFGRFAERHDTVRHEFLWMAGYPGARINQLSMGTFSVCQALPTQEYLFHDGVEPHKTFCSDLHFAVAYSPERAERFDISRPSDSPGLSDPHGLSGSLVWNTRRLECFYDNKPWDPNFAAVTGIVWGWPGNNYLIATKVEHFREFLKHIETMGG